MAAYAFECHGHPSGAHEWNIHQSGAHEWNTHRNMQRSSEHHYQRGPGHMQQAAPWEPREHTYRQPTWEPRERTHCQPRYVGPPCAPAGLSPPQINTAIIRAANTGNIRMLIQVIHHHLPNMNMVNLSTALYRCGKLAADNSHTRNMLASDPVVRRLLEVVFSSLQCMDPATPPCQAISNIVWALASMQRLEQELMGLIAHLSLASIHRFKFFELSSLLWAFAKLEAQSFLREQTCALFDMSTAQLEGNLRGLQLRTLSTISWAFATAKHIHIGFFRSLAQEIHRQARDAKPQEISNIVWAFGTARQKDTGLLEALADAGVRQVHMFKSQEISNTLWGMAANLYYHPTFFRAAVTITANREMNSQHLANIIWACARARPRHAATRSAIVMLVPRCVSIMHTFKPQEGASTILAVAKAFGRTGRESGPPTLPSQVLDFCYVAEQWVIQRTSSFSVQSFGNVISAFACLGPESHSQQLWSVVEHDLAVRAQRTSASSLIILLRSLLAWPVPACTTSPVALALCRRFPTSRTHIDDLLRIYSSKGGEVDRQGVEMALHAWLQSLARAEETPLIQRVPEAYLHEESQAWAPEGSAGADVQTSSTPGRADEGDIWTYASSSSLNIEGHVSEKSTDDPNACEPCERPPARRKSDRLPSWRNIVTFEELPDLHHYPDDAWQERVLGVKKSGWAPCGPAHAGGAFGVSSVVGEVTKKADYTVKNTFVEVSDESFEEEEEDDLGMTTASRRRATTFMSVRQPGLNNPAVTVAGFGGAEEPTVRRSSKKKRTPFTLKLISVPNRADYSVKNTFVEINDEGSADDLDELLTAEFRRRATTFSSDSAVKNTNADDPTGTPGICGTSSAPLKDLRARLRTTMMMRSEDAQADAAAPPWAGDSSEGSTGSVDPSPRAPA